MSTQAHGRHGPRRRQASDELWFTVSGYKAVRDETRVRIAPLTVIAGSNSAGKSSFMQPFLMMKQTLDSAFDPGALLLYGPNVRITDRTQVMSRGKARTDVVSEFSVGMEMGEDGRKVTFGTSEQEVVLISDEIHANGNTVRLSTELTEQEHSALRERVEETAGYFAPAVSRSAEEAAGDGAWDIEVRRNRCFLDLVLAVKFDGRSLALTVTDEIAPEAPWIELLQGIIHVPGLRGNPERAYSRSAVGRTYPGTFETYVASLVYAWTTGSGDQLTRLGRQLEALGLTWKIVARRLNDASIELLVGRTPHAQQGGANDIVSVADVGFGVSQTLPVLVSLLTASPGQVVYLEQPEIHLHPRAQVALASVLVEAAARGVRVVAETHSSLVIRGIQTAVAAGRLQPGDLSFNWFGRDTKTGFQTVTEAIVDSAGRFGDWPVDFDEVSSDADWAYLDAVQGQDR